MFTIELKKENVKKKVWFVKDVKQTMEASMMCAIDGETFFCSQRIHGSEILVHHVTSQMIIQVYLTSLTSMSQFKEALGTCQQQK